MDYNDFTKWSTNRVSVTDDAAVLDLLKDGTVAGRYSVHRDGTIDPDPLNPQVRELLERQAMALRQTPPTWKQSGDWWILEERGHSIWVRRVGPNSIEMLVDGHPYSRAGGIFPDDIEMMKKAAETHMKTLR